MQKPESQINALAAAQYGAFSRAQALECGLSSAAIGRRLTSGIWLRILPGVYRLASAPRTWQQWLFAAQLWAGNGAVISHRAAAAVLGLAGITCTFAELWVPVSLKIPSRAIQMHTTKDLTRTDLKKSGPLVVTNPTRTLIDLGAVINPLRLEVVLEDSLHRGLVNLPRLRTRLDELAGLDVVAPECLPESSRTARPGDLPRANWRSGRFRPCEPLESLSLSVNIGSDWASKIFESILPTPSFRSPSNAQR